MKLIDVTEKFPFIAWITSKRCASRNGEIGCVHCGEKQRISPQQLNTGEITTMPKRTKSHDTWLYEKLTDARVTENYINAALEDSPEMFLVAMRNVAEAHRMAKVAQEAGVNRESLYRAFSKQGNPTLNTLTSVLDAMGLAFAVKSKAAMAGVVEPAEQSGIPIVESTSGESVYITDSTRKADWNPIAPEYTTPITAPFSSENEFPFYLLTAKTEDFVFQIS